MPTGVYLRTEAHKRKTSATTIGRKYSEEHKRNMSKAKMGHKCSEAAKRKISVTMMGHKCSDATKRNISKAVLGKNLGSNNPAWKGGITPLQSRIRKSFKYQQWRQDVFLRDDFTCRECGQVGGYLAAHHIKPFSQLLLEAKQYLPLLGWHEACLFYAPMWDTANGITLCQQCHKLGRHGNYNISTHAPKL